jgi:hypothetical protein
MKQAFGLVRRPWGVFCLKNKITGEHKTFAGADAADSAKIAKLSPYFVSRADGLFFRPLFLCRLLRAVGVPARLDAHQQAGF